MPRPMKRLLETPRFLQIREAAARLGVSSQFMYELIQRGKGPPTCRFGQRLLRIRIEDFDQWAEANKKEAQNV